jgi:hypothetical protein
MLTAAFNAEAFCGADDPALRPPLLASCLHSTSSREGAADGNGSNSTLRALSAVFQPAQMLLVHVPRGTIVLDPTHVFPPTPVVSLEEALVGETHAVPLTVSNGVVFVPEMAAGPCVAFHTTHSAVDFDLVERTLHLLGGKATVADVDEHSLGELLLSCVRSRRSCTNLDAAGHAVLMRMLRPCAVDPNDLSPATLRRVAQTSGLADAVLWQSILWQPGAWADTDGEPVQFVFANLLGPGWQTRLQQNGYELPSRYADCLRSMAAQLLQLTDHLRLDVLALYRAEKPPPRSALALIRSALADEQPSVPGWGALRASAIELLDRKEMIYLGCVLVPLQMMRLRSGAPRSLAAVGSSEDHAIVLSDDDGLGDADEGVAGAFCGDQSSESDASDDDEWGDGDSRRKQCRATSCKRPRTPLSKEERETAKRMRAQQQAEKKRLASPQYLEQQLLDNYDRLPRTLGNRKLRLRELRQVVASGDVEELIPCREDGGEVCDATLMVMTDGAVKYLAECLGVNEDVIGASSRAELVRDIKRLSAPAHERARIEEEEERAAQTTAASNTQNEISRDPVAFFRRWDHGMPIWKLLGMDEPAPGETPPVSVYQMQYRMVVRLLKGPQIDEEWGDVLLELLNTAWRTAARD